jgi:ribosome-associated toxin RatA of RatAB toxin-antitoxin module
VLSRSDQEVVARLDLARGGVRQSFTTRNRLLRPESIDMQLVEGPFSAFAGRWTFKALTDSACKVSLRLEFVFKSELVSIAGSSLFKRVANNLVNATTREADRIATG